MAIITTKPGGSCVMFSGEACILRRHCRRSVRSSWMCDEAETKAEPVGPEVRLILSDSCWPGDRSMAVVRLPYITQHARTRTNVVEYVLLALSHSRLLQVEFSFSKKPSLQSSFSQQDVFSQSQRSWSIWNTWWWLGVSFQVKGHDSGTKV